MEGTKLCCALDKKIFRVLSMNLFVLWVTWTHLHCSYFRNMQPIRGGRKRRGVKMASGMAPSMESRIFRINGAPALFQFIDSDLLGIPLSFSQNFSIFQLFKRAKNAQYSKKMDPSTTISWRGLLKLGYL
jgi:hypothetical protein